jgi:hypothetical protein
MELLNELVMTDKQQNESPPVFKNWSGWYWLLISVALIQFLVYFLITRSFS